MQGFGQQSGSNSGVNQGNYGAPEADPGIDQSLSAHVPGGQGVSTATEQVISSPWLCSMVNKRLQLKWIMLHHLWMQGFGRVGGAGTGLGGSGTGQRGIDQSLGSHVPHGQNVGSAGGQVCLKLSSTLNFCCLAQIVPIVYGLVACQSAVVMYKGLTCKSLQQLKS
jgi:hypothetical protein